LQSALLLLMVALAWTNAFALQLAWLIDPVEGAPVIDWQPAITSKDAGDCRRLSLVSVAEGPFRLARPDPKLCSRG